MSNAVTFSDGSTITYSYAADGTKLRTVHTISGTTTTKDYCGNVVYENGVQKLLLTEEGYVDLSNNTYYYYLKDHQGNNRVVVSSGGTVTETNHYYPFGGVFASSNNVQPYKYNGKELDTKKGLNWYDYGARHYDATLGRWFVVDPLAEKYYAWSPYAYCFNNPIGLIDEEGKAPLKVLKAVWNVGKRAYKTYKKSGKLNVKQAFKDEALNIVDNVNTLLDSETSTFDKVIAGVDLLTGFGEEVSIGSKSLGIADDVVVGTRRKNRLPDRGEPNTVQSNEPGTTMKKYGPNGNVQKEFNKGHGTNAPKNEQNDHIHDYKPNPYNPTGRGERQPGRPLKKHELEKDFNKVK